MEFGQGRGESLRDEEMTMFPALTLHLHRLASRHTVRFERADPQRVHRLLKFYVRSLPALLNAERCNIFIYDPRDAKAWVEVGTGAVEGAFVDLTKSTLVGEVIASGKLMVANDLRGRKATYMAIRPVANFVSRNAIYAPVRSRYHDEVIGVIEVLNRKGSVGFGVAEATVLEEAAEGIQDLVDSVFLSQKVYGATDKALEVVEWTFGSVVGLMLLGSILTLLILASLSSMDVIGDALGPLMGARSPEYAR
jgi:hypothetical protein